MLGRKGWEGATQTETPREARRAKTSGGPAISFLGADRRGSQEAPIADRGARRATGSGQERATARAAPKRNI